MATSRAVDEQLISDYLEAATFVTEVSELVENFRAYSTRLAAAELDERTELLLEALARLIAARTALQRVATSVRLARATPACPSPAPR